MNSQLNFDFDLKKCSMEYKNWSLWKLAKELGIYPNMVYKWQKGKVIPNLETLLKLCRILNCTPNDLLGCSQDRNGV